MHTQVLLCDPNSISFPSDEPLISDSATREALLAAAQEIVVHSQVVAFPTETVYGLGANALSSDASSLIFRTKGRPADNPLIVHVSSQSMLKPLVDPSYSIPKAYIILMQNFCPGPLTLLFPRNTKTVPDIITAGQSTVAVRFPAHPVARALIALSNTPIAAPSANSSGKPSPTQAAHVERDLGGKLSFILDGGPCAVGLESTVVDGLQPDGIIRILRPGGVTVEQIETALKEHLGSDAPKVWVHRRDYQDFAMEHAPTTPGMKYRHYSPAVPVTLICTMSSDAEKTESASTYFKKIESEYKPVGLLCASDSALNELATSANWITYSLGVSSDPAQAASRLFDGLLTLEAKGVEIILIEEIAERNEGLAVMNRVRKAASSSVYLRKN